MVRTHTAQRDGRPFKKEINEMKGAGVEPRPLAPLAGMTTTTLPARRLLEPENCKTIKRYPYYFIRADRSSRLTEALSRLTGVK